MQTPLWVWEETEQLRYPLPSPFSRFWVRRWLKLQT
jgi:hypothetical protein